MSPVKTQASARRSIVRPQAVPPSVKRALRDMAFVLHLTQQVKAEMQGEYVAATERR